MILEPLSLPAPFLSRSPRPQSPSVLAHGAELEAFQASELEAVELEPAQSTAISSEPVAAAVTVPSASKASQRSALSVFLSTFLTIFLAELGDKTQLTTLLMTAESHSPWIVFAGAGTALVTTSLIGVCLGCWLAQRVSAKTLETAAGVLLLLISAQLFWEIFQL